MMMTEMSDQKRRCHHGGFLLTNSAQNGGGGCPAKKLRAGGASISPKEKKDKVGEKMVALQQLVCPFGKVSGCAQSSAIQQTDTASVLQEATGYIEFLHYQLQVLSAPYIKTGPNVNLPGEEHCTLRSRGLCLMPIESTLKVARSNGADLWAPTNPK